MFFKVTQANVRQSWHGLVGSGTTGISNTMEFNDKLRIWLDFPRKPCRIHQEIQWNRFFQFAFYTNKRLCNQRYSLPVTIGTLMHGRLMSAGPPDGRHGLHRSGSWRRSGQGARFPDSSFLAVDGPGFSTSNFNKSAPQPRRHGDHVHAPAPVRQPIDHLASFLCLPPRPSFKVGQSSRLSRPAAQNGRNKT